jgi:hypothetical protein
MFSIAMGAEYLSYVKSIATFALTFYGYIISVLASVWLIHTFFCFGQSIPFLLQLTRTAFPQDVIDGQHCTCLWNIRPSAGSDIVCRIIRQDNLLLMIAFVELMYKIAIEL